VTGFTPATPLAQEIMVAISGAPVTIS